MKTLKQLQANLKEGYEIVNFGSARPLSYSVWIVTGKGKDTKLILPKRFTVSFFIQECIEKGLVK